MPPAKKAAAPAAAVLETSVEALRHPADVTRRNIPTSETSSLMAGEEAAAVLMRYKRNPDLDPQLVWRGKDAQEGDDLSVPTVPIYIQEKVLPKALIRDLRRQEKHGTAPQADMFGGFDRIDDPEAKLEFYEHAENWSNRMILGDSLLVMNSLAEKEGIRGQVQMIYLDPPYGITFASNWQSSTLSTNAKEGKKDGLSREPEQIKAFRDTWSDGIHTYLSYLRDRLIVARELLADSGSIFLQMGTENAPLARLLLAEVFHSENHICDLIVQKTGNQTGEFVQANADVLVWFARDKKAAKAKFRKAFVGRPGKPSKETSKLSTLDRDDWSANPLTSDGFRETTTVDFWFEQNRFHPGANNHWKVTTDELARVGRAGRLVRQDRQVRLKYFWDDYPVMLRGHIWNDVGGARGKIYVVQTADQILQRCMLMTTDPGDLVLDPTCGSGTTAFVAEQWGRRWITTDTSRVALALARTRLMAGRHPAHLLRDSAEGAAKEAAITKRPASEGPFLGDVRQGFVLERVPHVTLGTIADNVEIDVIYEKWRSRLDAARASLNAALGANYEEWQVPRTVPDSAPKLVREMHTNFEQARRDRQAEMEASIARNAEIEYLYDQPYPKNGAIRVTGPFTVESLSPHRILPADEEDEVVLEALAAETGEPLPPRRRLRTATGANAGATGDFVTAVFDNLTKAGVQNTKKNERLTFSTLQPWPGGRWVSAEGVYEEGDARKRAAIVIGPEYGTVGQELVREAARECRDWADAMVVCGFAFDPQVGETTMNLGRLVVLKARMSQELHAADAYKAGGGNLFVVFGEPDIVLDRTPNGGCIIRLRGVDIFDPTTGEVRSSTKVEDDVACWFVDSDYDGDSFFVRHAYFLGGKDPFERLKAALKADIDADAWASLYATDSRPFPSPKSGRIAVKVINHYGDEAMRVFSV